MARTVASCGKNKAIYRDFDLDLVGHHEYNNHSSALSVEKMITNADAILTEYNIGGDVFYSDEEYAQKLIDFRQNMVSGGYKGGFQWCWLPDGAPDETKSGTAYYLLRNEKDPTSFRKVVSLLRYYIDEYRTEYRGEAFGLTAPVLYANAGDGKLLFIPANEIDAKITIQRSDDGGNSWKTLVSNAYQGDYVDEHLVGTYVDTTAPESGYCYRIIATDDWVTVTSAPNNVAGAEKKFNKEYVEPTYKQGSYYLNPTVTQAGAKLTSFTVEKNRPFTAKQNLIDNGGFEVADGPWNTSDFLKYASVVEDATTPDGGKSLFFDTSSKSQAGWYTFTVNGLKTNTEYTFSSFLKGAYLADDNKGMASLGVVDPDTGNFMVYWEYYKTHQRASRDTQQLYPTAWDDAWHLRAVSFNSGDNTSVTIALYGYSSQMWVDGMALFESANGAKYENGESANALTSDTWEDLSASGAANVITDPNVNDASYWNTGAGYKQGFMSIADGKLKYTASSHPVGVRYTKWVDVKPGTDYYVSYTVNVTKTGNGRVAVLDSAKELPFENLTNAFSSTGTKTIKGRISTGKHDQLGLCVVDLGGTATIDDVCIYEAGKSAEIEIPTEPSFDGYLVNGNFEVGTDNGWENLWGSNAISFVEGRDSLFAMKVSANQYTIVRQTVPVVPNTDYIVELWSKDCHNASLLVKDSADKNNIKQTPLNASSGWSKTVMEFNSGDNEFVYVGLMGTADGAYYTVDDVEMRLKNEESYDGYLYNGTFEIGALGHWENLWGNNTTHMVAGYDSPYAMSVEANAAWSIVRQKVSVQKNTDYVITLWSKNNNDGFLLVKDSADSSNLVTAELNYGSTWAKMQVEFNSGNNTFVYVGFMGGENGGSYTVDDVIMYEKPIVTGLLNGSFEDGELHWSFSSGYHAIVTDSYDGDYALQLQNPGMWASGAEQTISVTPNTRYTITWWYKATPGTGLFNLYVMNANGYANLTELGGENYMSYYTGDWQKATYVVNSGSAEAMILKFSTETANPGTILVDAVEVNEQVCDHSYDVTNYSSPTCGYDGWQMYVCRHCAVSYTETIPATGNHAYSAECDTTCNGCYQKRDSNYSHTYDNACDDYCNVCWEYRDVPGHDFVEYGRYEPTCGYDGGIEYYCRECGYWYDEYLPATGNHTYGGVCDAICNVCYQTRYTNYSHTYDNTCDAYCNRCNEWRDVPGHTTEYPCLSGSCIYCGAWITAIYSHDYDSYCDEYCNECGTYRDTYESHYIGTTALCQSGWCYDCGEYVAATQDHFFPYACAEECTVCGERNYAAEDHQSNTTPCEDGECVVCGAFLPSAGHRYSADCDTTCNVCDYVRTNAVIRNGGFELGWQEWSCWKELEENHQIVTDAHSGNNALQLSGLKQYDEAAAQIIEVLPDTVYTITWWYKAAPGTKVFNLFVMNADGYANLTSLSGQNYMNTFTGDWQKMTYTFYTGNAISIMLKISTDASFNDGTILIDDMSISNDALIEHEYEYGCSQVCSVCCELTRPEAEHAYDVPCSLWCRYCEVERTDSVEHDFTVDIIEPTCQDEGYRIYWCRQCGYEYDDILPATGHTYDSDCDADCNVCGEERYGETTLSFADISYRVVYSSMYQEWAFGSLHLRNDKAGSTSSVGSYYNPVRIYANSTVTISYPHMTQLVLNAYNSTTYLTGLTTTLNNAGLTYTRNGTEFTITFDQPVDSITLTAAGQFRLYSIIATAERDHVYDNDCDATCNACGAVRDADHVYDGVVTAPDCENSGYTTYTCQNCGDSYKADYTEAVGHNYVGEQTKAPTCAEVGMMTYTCSACGDSYTEEIAALGHDYNSVVTAPDCVNGGYTTYTCQNCGDSYKADYTEAVGHNYLGEQTKAPTCAEVGMTTYTCSACGDSYTEEIAVTDEHTYDHEYDTACNVCGAAREVDCSIACLGASVSENVRGLAMLFQADVEGIAVKSGTILEADFTNATYNGYQLLGLGAMVTNGIETITIKGNFLYDMADDYTRFAFRLVNIPADKLDVAITMTPYYAIEIDGVETMIYCEPQTKTYNEANS